LLQDFGHMDEEQLQDLYITLADIAGAPNEVAADLPLVRRVAAAMLFEDGNMEALKEIESGVLAEDWPFLFS